MSKYVVQHDGEQAVFDNKRAALEYLAYLGCSQYTQNKVVLPLVPVTVTIWFMKGF